MLRKTRIVNVETIYLLLCREGVALSPLRHDGIIFPVFL